MMTDSYGIKDNEASNKEIFQILGQMMGLIYDDKIPKEKADIIIEKAKAAHNLQTTELQLIKSAASKKEIQDLHLQMKRTIEEARAILKNFTN